eukprot:jgi/Bigna1/76617/fgenesh1_pg.42_\
MIATALPLCMLSLASSTVASTIRASALARRRFVRAEGSMFRLKLRGGSSLLRQTETTSVPQKNRRRLSVGAASSEPVDTIVQYVVVRRDLKDQWGTGPLIAQACHASTAALWLSRDEEYTKAYTDGLDAMHKVILSAKNENALRKAAKTLEEGGVKCKLWIEQPENIPTALATFPRPRSEIKPFTKGLQLFKD